MKRIETPAVHDIFLSMVPQHCLDVISDLTGEIFVIMELDPVFGSYYDVTYCVAEYTVLRESAFTVRVESLWGDAWIINLPNGDTPLSLISAVEE